MGRLGEKGLLYLGCQHIRGKVQLPSGEVATTMTYDMEDFFGQCVDSYLELSGLTKERLRAVQTPFLPEDHRESPAGAPQPGDNPVECPWCKHTFDHDSALKLGGTKNKPKTVSSAATVEGDLADDEGVTREASYVNDEGKTIKGKTRNKKKAKKKQQPVSWGDADPNAQSDDGQQGRLQPVAAKVLMGPVWLGSNFCALFVIPRVTSRDGRPFATGV